MIKINNKIYNEYKKEVIWDKFSVTKNGKKKTGIAPFLKFNINNEIYIGLELIYSEVMLKECKIDSKINITKYLSDICYADEKGWTSLIASKHELFITRINDNSYKIEFNVESDEIQMNIYINSNFII